MKKIFFFSFIICCLQVTAQDTCIVKKDYDSLTASIPTIKKRWDAILKTHPGSFPERKLCQVYNDMVAYCDRLKAMIKNKKAKYCK